MKIFLQLAGLAIVAAILSFFYYKKAPVTPASAVNLVENTSDIPQSIINAPGGTIHAMVVDSEPLREHGLSDRESIPDNVGMLFIFEQPAVQSFWMKDMHFPLDMVWIDKNKTVVGVTKNISPDTYPNTFLPPSPILYVLELNAGKAEQFGLKSGISLGW